MVYLRTLHDAADQRGGVTPEARRWKWANTRVARF